MKKVFGILAAAAACAAAIPALADSVESYTVGAYSTRWINISVCSPDVGIAVEGDGDTDLDFWIYNSRGEEVHRDTDNTDYTFARINTNAYGHCFTYQLKVRNFGRVYNEFVVGVRDL